MRSVYLWTYQSEKSHQRFCRIIWGFGLELRLLLAGIFTLLGLSSKYSISFGLTNNLFYAVHTKISNILFIC